MLRFGRPVNVVQLVLCSWHRWRPSEQSSLGRVLAQDCNLYYRFCSLSTKASADLNVKRETRWKHTPQRRSRLISERQIDGLKMSGTKIILGLIFVLSRVQSVEIMWIWPLVIIRRRVSKKLKFWLNFSKETFQEVLIMKVTPEEPQKNRTRVSHSNLISGIV